MRSIAEMLPRFVAPLDPSLPRLSGELPERLRVAVRERDRGICRYCGKPAKTSFRASGEVDHIIPCALGGSDDLDNLALACHVCNGRKGGRTPQQAGMQLRPIPEELHG